MKKFFWNTILKLWFPEPKTARDNFDLAIMEVGLNDPPQKEAKKVLFLGFFKD